MGQPYRLALRSSTNSLSSQGSRRQEGPLPVLSLEEFLNKSAVDWQEASLNQGIFFQRWLKQKGFRRAGQSGTQ